MTFSSTCRKNPTARVYFIVISLIAEIKKLRKLRAAMFLLCAYGFGAVVVSFTMVRDHDGVFLQTFAHMIDD